MRLALGIAFVGLLLQPGAAAEASSRRFPPLWLELVELAIPDSRYEFQGALRNPSFVMSWPVPVAFSRVHLNDPLDGIELRACSPGGCAQYWSLLPEAIVEPQVRLGGTRWRAVGAVRATLMRARLGPHVLAEPVGVIGQDGSGGGFGVGVGLGGALSIVYRSVWTTEGHRHELSLDVHLFSLPFSKFVDEVTRARKDEVCLDGQPCSDRGDEPRSRQ